MIAKITGYADAAQVFDMIDLDLKATPDVGSGIPSCF